jgi:hypothetical protein
LANVIYDFDGDRFWMAKKKNINLTQNIAAEPDPLLSDSDNIEVMP